MSEAGEEHEDIKLNSTDLDSSWTVSRNDQKFRRDINYKSDGKLFRETWETGVITRTYFKRSHSEDENIQRHRKTGLYIEVIAGDVYRVWWVYWPWSRIYSDLHDEVITEWTVKFKEDGTAEARIDTKQMRDDWETIKKHRPQRLKGVQD